MPKPEVSSTPQRICMTGVGAFLLTVLAAGCSEAPPPPPKTMCVQDGRDGICTKQVTIELPSGLTASKDPRNRGWLVSKVKQQGQSETEKLLQEVTILVQHRPDRTPKARLDIWLLVYSDMKIVHGSGFGVDSWSVESGWASDQYLNTNESSTILISCPKGQDPRQLTCTGLSKVVVDSSTGSFLMVELEFNKRLLPKWREVKDMSDATVQKLFNSSLK